MSTVVVKLPDGRHFAVGLDTKFSDIMSMCSDALNDPEIRPGNFSPLKHFFFRKGSTLIDEHVPEMFTLRQCRFIGGEEIELKMVPDHVRRRRPEDGNHDT